jgi:hypothetical protein
LRLIFSPVALVGFFVVVVVVVHSTQISSGPREGLYHLSHIPVLLFLVCASDSHAFAQAILRPQSFYVNLGITDISHHTQFGFEIGSH